MNRQDWEKQVYASNMNTTARLVALAIGSHGNWTDEKNVWPSITAIADMAGISRDTAKDYMTALEEQGWLRHVKTREKNVKEYELCQSVADTFGILAKRKRAMSVRQLQNLSTTDDEAVAETTPEQLPKLTEAVAETKEPVADTICTNLKEEPTIRNLKEEPTSNAPVADAPVASSNIKKRRFLNYLEKKSFDSEMSLNNVDQEDAKTIQREFEYGRYPSSLKFEEAIDYLLKEYDYTPRSREEW